MGNEGATEYRPRIRRKADGGVFVSVWTRRGWRSRTVSSEGFEWLRDRYPFDHYAAVEDIPLTYDEYRKMKALGYIGFHSRPKAKWSQKHLPSKWTLKGSAPTPAIAGLNSDTPPPGYQVEATRSPPSARGWVSPTIKMAHEQTTSDRTGTTQPSPPPAEYCVGCSWEIQPQARFCPRCGCQRQTVNAAINGPPFPPRCGRTVTRSIPNRRRQILAASQVIFAVIAFFLFEHWLDQTPAKQVDAQATQTVPAPTGKGDLFDQVAAEQTPAQTANPFADLPSEKDVPQTTTYDATHPVAENGAYYGEISNTTGLPRTIPVHGYYRRDGTYVRGYYRSP
jgi:hypothetical protein